MISPKYSEIQQLLLHLGATPNYIGFHYTAYAIGLCLEENQRLLFVTKALYPDVAKHFHTTVPSVERNIRTIISVIWKINPHMLEELAGFALTKQPSVGQFLAILAAHFSFPAREFPNHPKNEL